MGKWITNKDFVALYDKCGRSPKRLADHLGRDPSNVSQRLRKIERQEGISLASIPLVPGRGGSARIRIDAPKNGHRTLLDDIRGKVVVFSDAHIWPGDRSVAFDALLKLIRELQPKAIINNGDSFDGSRISRHPPVGWLDLPEVSEELEACKSALMEIETAAAPGTPLIWNMGNHDTRFSARLAQMAPDYVKVQGTDLPHHFPAWQFGWSTFINNNTVVKHRYHNGVHATWNNVLKAGMNIVTGHLHRLMVTPFSDYRGRRYGVDGGTLSAFGPDQDKFSWNEDSPMNWSQGFVVLTYNAAGDLLPPALVEVVGNTAYLGDSVILSRDGKNLNPRTPRP